MAKYLANAISLNMLAAGTMPCSLHVEELGMQRAAELAADAASIVGHAPTAAVFSEQLGLPVSANRATVTLNKGDSVVVGQYTGPRLEEGVTELPAGATIKWLLVKVA